MKRYCDIGSIVGYKGLQGAVLFAPNSAFEWVFSDGKSALDSSADVHFVPPKVDVPRNGHIVSSTPLQNSRVSLTFDSVSSVEVSSQLVGVHCLVEKAHLADCNFSEVPTSKLFTTDFSEWCIKDTETDFSGVVRRLIHTSAQPLLEVEAISSTSSACILVPLADDLIVDLDEASQVLLMKLPNGLLDL